MKERKLNEPDPVLVSSFPPFSPSFRANLWLVFTFSRPVFYRYPSSHISIRPCHSQSSRRLSPSSTRVSFINLSPSPFRRLSPLHLLLFASVYSLSTIHTQPFGYSPRRDRAGRDVKPLEIRGHLSLELTLPSSSPLSLTLLRPSASTPFLASLLSALTDIFLLSLYLYTRI